jgi:hypothetical protein
VAPPDKKPAELPPEPAALVEPPSSRITRRPGAASFAVPSTVIPLVHVPDDPGPEPEARRDPETEGPDKSSDGWSKLRGMFR